MNNKRSVFILKRSRNYMAPPYPIYYNNPYMAQPMPGMTQTTTNVPYKMPYNQPQSYNIMDKDFDKRLKNLENRVSALETSLKQPPHHNNLQMI